MSRKCLGLFALKVGTSLIFLLAVLTPVFAWANVKVVATYSILGDLVKNVGGDKVDLTVLVGAGGDAHTFEPTPQANIILSQAQVVFENGLHFEHWMDKLYQASGSKAARVVVSDGIEPIELDAGAEEEIDPHVWHDVFNVLTMVEHVRAGLVATDPTNESYYKERAEKYLYELGELDHWVIDTLKDIPDENRKLVTSHDTFGYFAKRYGFKVVGAGLESATTEASDPSASAIAALVEKVKAAGVKTVFVESMHNPKLMQTIAKEAGVAIAPTLYTDALGAEGSDGDSYVKMIQHNTRILAESLK